MLVNHDGLAGALSGLARWNPYRTADLDAARRYIGSLFVPHSLDITGSGQVLDVCIGRASLDGVSLVYQRHGASVRVRPELLRDFFLLQIPISGAGYIRADRQDVYFSPKRGVMISPALGIDMQFGTGCEQLIVRVERSDLERHLEAQLGHRLRTPLRFSPMVPLDASGPQQVLTLLRLMIAPMMDSDGMASGGMWRSSIARRHMVSLLLSGLLACLEHNYREELDAEVPPPKSGYLEKAQEFIAENLREPITPEDIAAAAQVSTRALYAAFRKRFDSTPMKYVRQLRLERVRELLRGSDPRRTSITTVATEYGFSHLGHFCASYKEAFGELPRDTLHKYR